MKITQDTSATLLLSEDSRFFRVAGYATFVFLALAAGFYFLPEEKDFNRIYGMLATAAFCAVLYGVFYEKNRFELDRQGQWLHWSRYHLFRRKSGDVPFGEISNVVLQTQRGDHSGAPLRRIVLKTVHGELPLTVGYSPNAKLDTIAERIREVLTMPPESLTADSVAALVRDGRTIEAVRMLREQEGLSLTEAKARVDAILAQSQKGAP